VRHREGRIGVPKTGGAVTFSRRIRKKGLQHRRTPTGDCFCLEVPRVGEQKGKRRGRRGLFIAGFILERGLGYGAGAAHRRH
jgi:hypothetical protein